MIKTKMIGITRIDVVSLGNLLATSKTHAGDDFILFDNVYQTRNGESKRVVVFSSGVLLEIARRVIGVFLGDGTFDSVPTMFRQLYTIHAEVDGSAFP